MKLAYCLLIPALLCGQRLTKPTNAQQSTPPPTFHGGPLLDVAVPLTVYYIWYGNWTVNSPEVSLLGSLAQNLGGSPWFLINGTYFDAAGAHPTGAMNFGGQAFDAYSQGSSIGDEFPIVASALNAGLLPVDPNGAYIVLPSSDVSVFGYCTSQCAHHRSALYNGVNLKYGYVGDPITLPVTPENVCGPCTIGSYPGPNGNTGADSMASWIAHELSEIVTDPNGTAWFNVNTDENADLCVNQFGKTFHARNHALANVTMGGLDWLLQENWKLGVGCALK